MTKKLSRREFLKLAGVGASATAVLTGCGTASRYVTREPYTKMPEYNYNGQSTYYASSCRECPAGCGIVDGERLCRKHIDFRIKDWREYNIVVHEWERKKYLDV